MQAQRCLRAWNGLNWGRASYPRDSLVPTIDAGYDRDRAAVAACVGDGILLPE
jgi:hypothetical protein